MFCIAKLVRDAVEHRGGDGRFAYIAPLFRQAKQVAWDYLKQYTEEIPGRKIYENDLRVELPNGAKIQLFGADNPDALRGMYLDGVIMDEFAQARPALWGSVIRPLLTDRKGWAIFIGTPMGHNEFYDLYLNARDGFEENGKRIPDPSWAGFMYRASETGIVDAEELRAAQREMSPEEYEQEFECSFEAAIRGSYYGAIMGMALEEGRVGSVSYDPAVPVNTAWDLGIGDSTAIVFFQNVGTEIHIIDYYEDSGLALADYVRELQERPYVYGEHLLPHDAKARELISGKTREEVLNTLLNNTVRVVENHRVDDGIQAVRNHLGRCHFDLANCHRLVEALKQYRKEFDEVRKVFKNRPLHNWCSHPSDAFRYMCMGTAPAIKWDKIDYGDDRVYV